MSDDEEVEEVAQAVVDPLALTQRFYAAANVCGLTAGQQGDLYVNEDVLGCVALGFLVPVMEDGSFAAAPLNVGPAAACCGRPR